MYYLSVPKSWQYAPRIHWVDTRIARWGFSQLRGRGLNVQCYFSRITTITAWCDPNAMTIASIHATLIIMFILIRAMLIYLILRSRVEKNPIWFIRYGNSFRLDSISELWEHVCKYAEIRAILHIFINSNQRLTQLEMINRSISIDTDSTSIN